MSHLLITRTRSPKKGFKKRTLAETVHIGANSLVIFVVTLICLISLAYLVHSNKTATKGYVLKQLQKEKSQLVIENEIWDMKISRARSLASLGSNSFVAKMVDSSTPTFVRGDSAMASSQK